MKTWAVLNNENLVVNNIYIDIKLKIYFKIII